MLDHHYAAKRKDEIAERCQRIAGSLAALESIFLELRVHLVPPGLEHRGEILAPEGDDAQLLGSRACPGKIDRQPGVLGTPALRLDRPDDRKPFGRLALAAVRDPGKLEGFLDLLAFGIVTKVGTDRRLARHRLHQRV